METEKRRALNVEISLSRQWRHPSQTRLRGLSKLEAKIEEGGEGYRGGHWRHLCVYILVIPPSFPIISAVSKDSEAGEIHWATM